LEKNYFPGQTIAIRSEALGPGIQSNIYNFKDHTARIFDVEVNGKYLDFTELYCILTKIGASARFVPVLASNVILKDWLAEKSLQEASRGKSVLNPERYREGIVIKPMKEQYIIGFGRPNDEIYYCSKIYYHSFCLSKKIELETQSLIDSNGKDYDHLYNLAKDENCDYWIKAELTLAHIPFVSEPQQGEVPSNIKGVLDDFIFRRVWRYWVVTGDVPLNIAKELYADPIGEQYVRVVGHCGCPAPEEWASLNKQNQLVISSYHIDTLPGLKLFVEKIKPIIAFK
jgi:hypothetical protein